jgi:hypothetical protein
MSARTAGATYIDLSCLRVGDVLLTQSKDTISRTIAKATGGRFSHAALYVREYQIFEATTTGVGFGALEPSRIELLPGGKQRVLCSTQHWREVAAFRCPDHFRHGPSRTDDDLLIALYPLLWNLNGLEYKRLLHFAGIKSRFDWIPRPVRAYLLEKIGNRFLKDHRKILVEEFFCSELVPYVLCEVGMEILKKAAACPSTLSPKDLADHSITNLIEIADALRKPDPAAAVADASHLTVARMIASPSSKKSVVKQTKELAALTDAIRRRDKGNVRREQRQT